MATTDPVEILNRQNAEIAEIRGYADLSEEAKARRIAEVTARARAEYAEAREAGERERAERVERTRKAVFRVPVSATATDAEEAQIHAAFRSAYNDVSSSTASPESQGQAEEELGRLLQQAERTGDKLLARATYHRGIDLGAQSVVDAYLLPRPAESARWESYTTAHQEARESQGLGGLLERSLAGRAFSSEAE